MQLLFSAVVSVTTVQRTIRWDWWEGIMMETFRDEETYIFAGKRLISFAEDCDPCYPEDT